MSSFLFLLRDSLQKILLLSPLPLLVILLTVIAPSDRSPVRIPSVQQSLPNGASGSWYQSAMNEIERSEYDIRWQEQVSAYQSPNRRQNLRFTYHADGFTVTPRQPDNVSGPRPSSHGNPTDWSITFALAKIEKGSDAIEFSGRTLHVEKNTASIEDDNLQITYANNEEGMRQNFIVKHSFSQDDSPLTLQMSLDTDLDYDTHGTGILFRNHDREEVLRYNRLKAWDAEGRILAAKIQGHGGGDRSTFAVVVDDRNASYPITIDPLSSTEDWTAGSGQASSSFGYSVSTAGSVNGDGYSDIIIGAPYYDNGQTNEGRAYVYYGSSSGFPALADWIIESNQANAFLGVSVASAGSVNGDIYSDIIVGASGRSIQAASEGCVYVFHGSMNGLSSTVNWTARSDQILAFFGVSVSTAGDVNGDGYSDIIVGSVNYDNGQTNEGRVFIWHGSSIGLGVDGTPLNADWTAESNQADARFGGSVSTASDVNGDSYSDIIVGADAYDNGQMNEGRVFVWFGSSTGLGTSGTPANADWMAESDQASACFGFSVSTAGDVNGDGYSDVIVGADSCDNGQSNEGRAFVWHGSSTGLGTSGTPSNADWSAESNQASARFGYSVSIAGDVNGDGYADVIIGAPDYDNGETNEGRVYVYHGSSTGLSTSANWIHESDQDSAAYGCCVRTAGDVNADGCSDVLIGARNYDNSSIDAGRVFVYNGAPSGLSEMATANWMTEPNQESSQYGFAVSSAGDVNGDGYSDIIVGAYYFDNGESNEGSVFVFHGGTQGPSATPDWSAEANQASAYLGMSVSTAGDVNGDGYSDIIVGAQNYDNPETNEGVAFVWHGSASGLGANGTPSNADWFAESNQSSPRFARIVSTVGDVNGDGYSDVLVGAPEFDSGQSNEGKVFLWYGSASGLGPSGTPLNADWTAESNQASAYYGFAASTAGDVNGDGFSDVLVGAYFYDNPEANEGMAFVYHGGASGPSTSADWFAESNQDGAYFGNSVSTAGDVNGDGYSDIIIGASSYDDVSANAGRAFVWFGSSIGLGANGNPSNAGWRAQVNIADSQFGESVSTAGDVNGDGYSDIIIGAPMYESTSGEPDEGMAFVWHGSPSGLGSLGTAINADWNMDQDQADASFGIAVACAGDVNGDGYSDVIVGARYYTNVENNEGAAYVFLGGGGSGLSLVPRQWRTDLKTPVVIGLKTRAPNQVGLELRGRTFFGRSEVKVQYEVKPLGTPFDGGTVATPSWTDVGTSGVALQQLVSGLTERTLYKWRARISYRLSDGAPQVRGRWIYPNANGGLGEADFQVSADDVPLPVEMLSLSASAHGTTAVLHWITATELNNYGFEIERRTVGLLGTQGDANLGIWENVGFVNGSGTSAKPVEYRFEDRNLPDGRYTYRIKQIDKDGRYRYTESVEVSVGDVPTVFSLDQNYPNPFNPVTTIQFGLPKPSNVEIVLYDLLGKAVTTIVEKDLPLGFHRVEFDGSRFASSVYFYRLTAKGLDDIADDRFVQTRKMILLR